MSEKEKFLEQNKPICENFRECRYIADKLEVYTEDIYKIVESLLEEHSELDFDQASKLIELGALNAKNDILWWRFRQLNEKLDTLNEYLRDISDALDDLADNLDID